MARPHRRDLPHIMIAALLGAMLFGCVDTGTTVADGTAGDTSQDTRPSGASCSDEVRNGNETDIDCGGTTCHGCVDGRMCLSASDCESGFCAPDGFCASPSCTDGILNGDEVSTDCGGEICSGCPIGTSCSDNEDCASGYCETGACADTCGDGSRSGDETDIDCGGSCAPCADGSSCGVAGDCESRVCGEDYSCVVASCEDMTQNGDESDIDCGGSCEMRCAEGRSCSGPGDCESGVCDGSTCTANTTGTCNDGERNGNEAGVDCGGSCPTGCPEDTPCTRPEDCASGVCSGTSVCAAPNCEDEVLNGDETDTDCGGSCNPCPPRSTCLEHSDCNSRVCVLELCRVAGSCREINDLGASVGDGIYTIDPQGNDAAFEVFCDMTTDGGGWTQLAHVRRELGMPYPGRESIGTDPAVLGYSINATGLEFSEMALTHNGLPAAERFAQFTLSQPTTFDATQSVQRFLLDNGTFNLLSLPDPAGGADIPLTCFNSSTADCLNLITRDTSYGAVSAGTGACRVLNDGDGVDTTCGGWGLAPNAGDLTWVTAGGRIFVR